MSSSTTALYTIAAAATALFIYAVTTSPKRIKRNRKRIAGKNRRWEKHTMDSFTGWLERLRQDIGNEINPVHNKLSN